MNAYQLTWGGRTIDYTLLYCDRKTMEIAVCPDSSVVVKAPLDTSKELVEKKLTKRARWIVRQKNYFGQFNPKTPARSYVSGETHLYLGRQYRLKILQGSENSIRLTRGYFSVTSRDVKNSDMTRKLLEAWYLEKAREQFSKSLDRCCLKLKNHAVARPHLSIRRMQKRWGSLSEKGTMTLNRELIRAPRECIDYVVTHELCHLIYRDHSPEFYTLLESIIPGWEKVKHRLELSMV
ncbi:MAG TPA: M48 family peptidase [Chlorobaculum parvum]|uniref:M48 family peptidase n=1 Tax=Chlorobaculum parvum TaxID=274539 RepID=A0A7C5HHA1_9CHLB|nr:M48 family peptidase [Chlorobaculum parvum]